MSAPAIAEAAVHPAPATRRTLANFASVAGGEGRLRVAHVTLGLDVGGQEKLLVEFARHADREGFELVFVSLTDRGQLAAG